MDVEITRHQSFDEFPMPTTLYKYRDFGNNFHIRIITKREVFFAPPTSFEDKTDCKNPPRWDLLTYEDLLNRFFQDSRTDKFNYSSTETNRRVNFAIEWANKTPKRDQAHFNTLNDKWFAEFDSLTGVLSLTEYPSEFTMWNKYSNNHTGFCVGFEPIAMLKDIGTGGAVVNYYERLPNIFPTPKHSYTVQTFLQFFSKELKWAFEKEYRTFIFKKKELTTEDRTIILPPSAYKEIILGTLMSEQDIDLLLKLIPDELKHVKIKQAVLDGENITIEDYENLNR